VTVGGEAVIVVRGPNWLGDTVMALPALRALRAERPTARITLAGRWAPLLAGQGVADVLLSYPRPARERGRFNRALGAAGADLAILFPSSLESALAARRWRARRRIGFDADARGPLLTDAIALPAPRQHQVDEYSRLLEPLGIRVLDGTPTWTLARDGEADRAIDALLAEVGLGDDAQIVGLHIGAAFGPSKLWPVESFARLAAELEAAQLSPLLLGSPADAGTADRVIAASDRAPASLVGRDRPELLPRLFARLGCLVSGDTGVAHLAAAVGIPTVTLFGPTDPGLSAPRGRAARVVARPTPCAPCFLAACPIEHGCLRDIKPDDVARQVRRAAAA